MFRSLTLSACLIGVVLGLVVTAIQAVGVTPILLNAEQYEGAGDPAPVAHEHVHGEGKAHHHGEEAGGHHHGGDEWAPEDGAERTIYTTVSNIFAGIGFSAVLLVVMTQLRERGKIALTPSRGLLLGAMGFLAVFLAPSIGLPPEVPGTAAAPLEARQLWWIFTVLMAAAGLGLLGLAKGWVKLVGIPLLLIPYFFVPIHEGPLFSHPNPAAVAALTELHHQFMWATGLTNLIFWLLAGVLCALALKRLYEASPDQHDEATA